MTKAFNKLKQKSKRRVLRKNMPKAEQTLWYRLRHKQLSGFKFRRQYSIDQYILDFYCPEARLGIEVDGPSHFYASGMRADATRSAHLDTYGIRVLRFTNNDIYENMEGVVTRILESLSQIERVNPDNPQTGIPS